MKLHAIAALACLAVLPVLADEQSERAEPKVVTYEYKGVAFKVHAPENGRMKVEHPSMMDTYQEVGPRPASDTFSPGSTQSAKEALDNACQSLLDVVERQMRAEKNRPHLEKEIFELYEELAGKG